MKLRLNESLVWQLLTQALHHGANLDMIPNEPELERYS